MIKLIEPKLEELWFKQEFLRDKQTMSYNHAYGGTIDFPKEKWESWYQKWIGNHDTRYFYRYIYSEVLQTYVGEVAYRYEEKTNCYICDVIVHAKYRGQGFGTMGLNLLCLEAKKNGLSMLYDEILLDNPSIHLFLKNGFILERQTDEVFVVRREL